MGHKMALFFGSAKAQLFFFSLVVFTLPLKYNYNSMAIILLALYICLRYVIYKKGIEVRFGNGKWLLFYFGIVVLGMLYTDNIEEGAKYINRFLPFLVFPLIFSVTRFDERKKNGIMWAFCASCFLVSVFLFFANLQTYLNDPMDTSIWYYSHYTAVLDIHPAHLMLFLIFNVFFLFGQWYKHPSRRMKFIMVLFNFVFIVHILFLQSRVGIISFLILLPVYLFVTKKRIKKTYMLVPLFLFVVAVAIAYQFDFVQRLLETPASLKERLTSWHGWWQSYKEHPFFGYGTGDAQMALDYGNYLQGNNFPVLFKYNTHDQYLDALLRFGFIGFFFFLLIFYKPYKSLIKNTNRLLLLFLVLINVFLLTENLLERHRGIVFFSFFYLLLNKPALNEN